VSFFQQQQQPEHKTLLQLHAVFVARSYAAALMAAHNSRVSVAAAWILLQSPKLLALKAQLDEAAKEQSSLAQQVSALQGKRDRAAEQLKKLTAEKASMQTQLGSSADDINLLQVR
jgi:predicted nuclease with TOPRIM domain